jgi:hypothetical protein
MSLEAMAVSAKHDALGYFALQSIWHPAHNLTYVGQLTAALLEVVEIENNWLTIAALDAPLLSFVERNKLTIDSPKRPVSRGCRSDAFCWIFAIRVTAILSIAQLIGLIPRLVVSH